MTAVARNFRVGPGTDAGVTLGPIQNAMQFDKVADFLADSARHGHNFACGGPDLDRHAPGYFVQPTIIDRPPDDARIVVDEQFSPIVPTLSFTDDDDVIRRANATPHGLGASVFAKDVDRAVAIARRLEAGSVYVNSWAKIVPQVSFGGHKESGIGVEWGKQGLLAFCNAQVLHVYKSTG